MEVERQSDLQEFQYGKDVFQTTTNNIRKHSLEKVLLVLRLPYKGHNRLFGYGNIEWQEAVGSGFESQRMY